jgi:hypothetical protein
MMARSKKKHGKQMAGRTLGSIAADAGTVGLCTGGTNQAYL